MCFRMEGRIEKMPLFDLIPPHDGDHRIFEKTFPSRPWKVPLTSTIEAVWSPELMIEMCMHRTDYLAWHGLDCCYEYPSYGSCLNTVTLYNDHDNQTDMVILEGPSAVTENRLPPKLYRLPLPTARGLNHIVWCDSMELTHEDPRILEHIVPTWPRIPSDVIKERYVATISFPEVAQGRLYKRLGDQPSFTPTRWSPGDYYQKERVLVHQPYLEEVTKKGQNYPSGIRIQPQWLQVLSDKTNDGKDDFRKPLSLFAQAYLKSSRQLDDEWRVEGQLPTYLSERYIHLRYKPADNGPATYQYQHGWPKGADIRRIFTYLSAPRFLNMSRYEA